MTVPITDEAVQMVHAAVVGEFKHYGVLSLGDVRAALEVAGLASAPRPVIDREALEISARNKIAEWYGSEWNASEDKFYETYDGGGLSCVDDEAMLELRGVRLALDAVTELARPMPTREQIAEALHRWHHESGSYPTPMCSPERPCSSRKQIAETTADVVVALLNGSES